ncbi:hypothetical protein SAMN05660776_0116 [Salegentibacter holothuriorum]|uniref:Uncharacterized protein n=1 Tax=Salegentibacter holothuriorum TaxID=241145 RepID=A0A1T5ENH3_9FLAO|nr:hypothetical protein SAMN05660776_0116 [Salegentibacter holothuriorum]
MFTRLFFAEEEELSENQISTLILAFQEVCKLGVTEFDTFNITLTSKLIPCFF